MARTAKTRSAVALGLFLTCWLPAAPTRAQTRLYLAESAYNDPKLKTMFLDGSAPQELIAPPASDWLPVGLDYDPVAAKIYWTHGGTPGLIRRADADGSNQQLLLSGLNNPRGLSLDTLNGWMYWSESQPEGNAMGLIRRAHLDGTGVQTIYTLTPYDPAFSYVGMPSVDPANGYVYFCAANEIRRVKLDGTGSVQTVVRGVNTAVAVALDVSNNRIYFLDSNTNSDVLASARLDDSDFTVHLDDSPGSFEDCAFFDLKLDRLAGKTYFTDETAKTVRRCNLDGTDLETIYTSLDPQAPTGLTFDADPLQPILDCNQNGIRDLDDLDGGFSQDCNVNGIPDECESDPCLPVVFDLDHGSNPDANGRTLSGNPTSGVEVFQPFSFATVPEVPGLVLERIGLDGWTHNFENSGFRATIFPDNGAGFPDESLPLAWADFQLRFSPNTIVWAYRDVSVFLPSGQYYMRLTANAPQYDAELNVGISGPPSFSRRLSNGQIAPSAYSIALRLKFAGVSSAPESPRPSLISLAPPAPNPASRSVRIGWSNLRPGLVRLSVMDPGGRAVWSRPKEWFEPGEHAVLWNGRDSAGHLCHSGTYFVRLTALDEDGQERVVTQTITLVR
jgi:hypothetical protein